MISLNNASNFMVKYKESWVEEGLLYIKQEFCELGDLFDFMETLEENNFNFNTDFFWDLTFQMVSVRIKLINLIH